MESVEEIDRYDVHIAFPNKVNVPEIDPEWINPDVFRAWMRTCDEEHNCSSYPSFGTAPAWLIDIDKGRLVSTSFLAPIPRYCALSYVWGKTKTSKLTRATQTRFCQPGAFLATNSHEVTIPTVVRHSIELLKVLGGQYLWVDALCIIQDDDIHFQTELRNMGAIYNNAYLTIVAATGDDANEPLRGLRDISPRRHLASNFADDLPKYLNPKVMAWNSRGWTFQEGQLSRRMIMFCGQTAMWKCIHSAIDEAGNLLKPSEGETNGGVRSLQRNGEWIANAQGQGKKSKEPLNRLSSWGPDRPISLARHRQKQGSSSTSSRACKVWEKINAKGRSTVAKLLHNSELNQAASFRNQFVAYLDEAVHPFNTRSFTDKSDVVPAFEGIAHFLTQDCPPTSIYSEGLCWGLPLAYFPQALTWTTEGEDLRPRDPSLGFPTWSWFAWEGSITADKLFFPAESEIKFIIADSDYESTVEWGFTSSIPDQLSLPAAATPSGRHLRAIRLVAQRAVIYPEHGRLYRGTSTGWPFYWMSRDIHQPAILLADQPSELGFDNHVDYHVTGHVELVCISKFDAAVGFSSGDPVLSAEFVKALWIARLDPSPAEERSPDGGTRHLRVRRRGVAIVHHSLWDRYAQQGGQRLVTILE